MSEPIEPRRKVGVSCDLVRLLPFDRLLAGLAARQIGICDCAEEVAAVVVGDRPGPDDIRLTEFARGHGLPILTIEPGRIPGTLRLLETLPGEEENSRLRRLLTKYGAGLAEEVIGAAADRLPDGEGSGSRDEVRRLLALEAIFDAFPPEEAAAAVAEAVFAVGRQQVPRVTIVINNFNYGAFVGEAIRSALDQTLPPLEVIVVDDGSTDDSASLISAIPGTVPVFQSNGGQASALNAGFRASRGEVILFLDADDRLLPGAVAAVSRIDPRDYARLQFDLATIDQAGRPTGLYPEAGRVASGHLLGSLAYRGIFPFMPTSGNAFPRRVLDRLMPMPEEGWRICADLYLILAATMLGPVRHIGDVLGEYRIHGRNAHFRPLIGEPFLEPARQHLRLRAWRSLLRRLTDLVPPVLAIQARIAFQDLVLRAAFADTSASARDLLRDSGLALALALRTQGLPQVRRLQLAARPAALAWRRFRRGASIHEPMPWGPEDDAEAVAGASGWPSTAPGEVLDLTRRNVNPDPLGHGWTRARPEGAILQGPIGSLALLLPEIRADWRIRLGFTVTGDEPLRGVAFWCNGRRIGRFVLHREGEIDLSIPRDLLSLNPRGGLGCCLVVEAGPGGIGRLRLTRLLTDLHPGMGPRAPFLPEGVEAPVHPGSLVAACLVSGWSWPDTEGVVMDGARARFDFSVPPGAPQALTLALREGPASRLLLAVNGALVVHHAVADGRSLTLELPAVEPPGRIRVELFAFPDPETGDWPTIRIAGIRRDGLAEAGRSIALNIPRSGAELRASSILDGTAVRLSDGALHLPLELPALPAPARLLVHLVVMGSAERPPTGALSVAGQTVPLCLSRDSLVPIDLPAAARRTVALEGSFDGPSASVALRSLCLISRRERRFPSEPLPMEGARGHQLLSFVTEPDAWHPPDEDALWLACAEAELVLPPLPGARSLEVAVLTIGNPPQRLTLQAGMHSVRSAGQGYETLRLPLPEEATLQPTRLIIATDLLVAAGALGLSGSAMLGGALAAIRPCGSFSRSTPSERAAEVLT